MTHGASVAGHGADHAHEHEHPSERVYIRIAIILALITVVEVAIYYFDLGNVTLVTLLLFFSAIKFVTVVGYFMHLKFDDRRLLYIFLGGLFLGGSVLGALDVLHHTNAPDYAINIVEPIPAGEGDSHD